MSLTRRSRSSELEYSIDPHARLKLPLQRLDELAHEWLGGRLGRPRPARRRRTRDFATELLGLPHRELVAQRAVAQVVPALGIRHLQQSLSVAHGQSTPLHVLLNLARELEQSEVVGHARAILGDLAPDLLLGRAGLGEGSVGVGELDGVEILALDILDDRELEAIVGCSVGHDRRDAIQAGRPRRPPAALSDDELEALSGLPHNHWL